MNIGPFELLKCVVEECHSFPSNRLLCLIGDGDGGYFGDGYMLDNAYTYSGNGHDYPI